MKTEKWFLQEHSIHKFEKIKDLNGIDHEVIDLLREYKGYLIETITDHGIKEKAFELQVEDFTTYRLLIKMGEWVRDQLTKQQDNGKHIRK